MERRAFLRGLLLAPVVVPVAMKAEASTPNEYFMAISAQRLDVGERLNVGGVEVKNITQADWVVSVDSHGHAVGVKLNNASA